MYGLIFRDELFLKLVDGLDMALKLLLFCHGCLRIVWLPFTGCRTRAEAVRLAATARHLHFGLPYIRVQKLYLLVHFLDVTHLLAKFVALVALFFQLLLQRSDLGIFDLLNL